MATTQYDRRAGLASSTAVKGPCYVATTANIALAGLQTIDGVAVAANDRVLVKDQTDASENGIYVASTGDWFRAADFNRSDDVREGTMVRVTDGDVAAGLAYIVSTADPITVGTSDIAFAIDGASAVAAALLIEAEAAADAAEEAQQAAEDAQAAAEAAVNMAAQIHAADAKTTLADADEFGLWDSVSELIRKITWANIKAALKATAANFQSNDTALFLSPEQVWLAAEPVDLGSTMTGNISLDFDTFLNAYGIVTGDITFNAASNIKQGQGGLISISAAAERTLSFNTAVFSSPGDEAITLPIGRTKLSYYVDVDDKVFVSLAGSHA